MEEQNIGIEDLLKDALKAAGKSFTDQDIQDLKATYSGNENLLFEDVSSLTGKKFNFKNKIELKRGYGMPLSFKETLALGESRGKGLDPDTTNDSSSAYGPFQITETHHKDRIKSLYGADWSTFQKDPKLQEQYMDVIEGDYDKNLPSYKEYPIAKQRKLTDEQIKATMHVLGASGAKSYLQTGRVFDNDPSKAARKEQDLNQILDYFVEERTNFGGPGDIMSQYNPAGVTLEETPKAVSLEEYQRTMKAQTDALKSTTARLKGAKAQPKETTYQIPTTSGHGALLKTEELFQDVKNKQKELDGNFLTQAGDYLSDVGAGITGLFKYGTVTSGYSVSQRERGRQKEIEGKKIQDEKRSILQQLPAEGIPAVSIKDAVELELASPKSMSTPSGTAIVTMPSAEEAHRKGTLRIKEHTELLKDLAATRRSSLTKEEASIVDNMNSLDPEFLKSYQMSDNMKSYILAQKNLNDQIGLNEETFSKYNPLIEESYKAILNARQNGSDPKQAFNDAIDKYSSENPEDDAAIKTIKTKIGMAFDVAEPIVGVPVAEQVQETAYGLGKTVGALIDFTKDYFGAATRTFSPNTKFDKQLLKDLGTDEARGKIRDIIVNNPNDASTSDLIESLVKIGDRTLVLKNGKVDKIRDKEGKQVYYPTKQDAQIIEQFGKNPDKYEVEKDVNFSAGWQQGVQVLTDMVPMIAAASATGGGSMGMMLGSAAVSYGDYYEQALAETGDISKSSLYAAATAGAIGYVESKIGKAEALFGRAFTGAEKSAIIRSIEEVAKKESSKGVMASTLERGFMQKVKEVVVSGQPILKEVPLEVIEELTNFPVEGLTAATFDMPYDSPGEAEVINTIGLTTLVTTLMGGIGGVASSNRENLNSLISLGVNNRDGFKEVADAWVQSAKDKNLPEDEINRRQKEVEKKSKLIETVGKYYDFIKEESEDRKISDEKKNSIMELAQEKAMLDYKADGSTSTIRKDKIAAEAAEVQKKLDKLVYSGTDIAEPILDSDEDIKQKEEAAAQKKKDKEKQKTQEDAIQEQKATEVPVQPEATGSGADTQGQPQPESQGTTQQGQAQEQVQGEEVKAKVAALGQQSKQAAGDTQTTQPIPTATEAEKVAPTPTVEAQIEFNDLTKLDTNTLEVRQAELEVSENSTDKEEFNRIDKELVSREWGSVINAPLDSVINVVQGLEKKSKDMPNGFGAYIDSRDARETKSVAKKYLGDVSKQVAKKDFKDAFLGNPSNWYADGLKLKESVRVFLEKGGTFKDLLKDIQKEFETDGFTEQEAMGVIKAKLDQVSKVNITSQQQQPAAAKTETPQQDKATEKEVETLLEPIGKTPQERENQIFQFFALTAAGGDKTKAREIARVTNNLWENVAKQLGKRSKQAAEAWIQAKVALIGKTSVAGATGMGNAKFQIIGEKGAKALDAAEDINTRLNNLVLAKKMKAAGKDDMTTRLATGWEKGVDGKWKYEITDDMGLDNFNAGLEKDGLYGEEVFVSDFLDPNSKLLKAYPQLKDTKVVINRKKIDSSTRASYSRSENRITLYTKNISGMFKKDGGMEGAKSTLLHEVQHAIQEIEGFAKGGNSKNTIEYEDFLIKSQKEQKAWIQDDIDTLLGKIERDEYYIERSKDKELQKYLENEVRKNKEKVTSLTYVRDSIKEGYFSDKEKYDAYKSLAGEVEARNVQSRMNMSPEVRRQTLLQETQDVANEDQIVIIDSFDNLANSIAAGNVKFQADNANLSVQQAIDKINNNLLPEIDRLIKEMSNKDNIKKRGWTTAQAAEHVRELRAVKAQVEKNMKDPKFQANLLFHGTSKLFPKFSTEKIGTGNKSQFGGWGLYFTLEKGRAEGYAEQLANKELKVGDVRVDPRSDVFKDVKNILSSGKSILSTTKDLLKLAQEYKTKSQKSKDFYFQELGGFTKANKKYQDTTNKDTLTELDKEFINNFERIQDDFYFSNGDINNFREVKGYARELLKSAGKITNTPGYLYVVSVPESLSLFDFDVTVSDEVLQTLLAQDKKEGGKFKEILTNPKFFNGDGRNYYFSVASEMGGTEALSKFMLRAGIDGNTMLSDGFNKDVILFDDKGINTEEIIKFQEDAAKFRAATIELANNQVILAALDSPNESSFVHEMAHSFESDLLPEERQTFIDEYNELFGEKEKGWSTDVSEYFARTWEKYLSNGRKLTSAEVKDKGRRETLQEVFDKFTDWLQGIYNGVIEYNNSKGVKKEITLSPAAQAIFDNINNIKTQTKDENKESSQSNGQGQRQDEKRGKSQEDEVRGQGQKGNVTTNQQTNKLASDESKSNESNQDNKGQERQGEGQVGSTLAEGQGKGKGEEVISNPKKKSAAKLVKDPSSAADLSQDQINDILDLAAELGIAIPKFNKKCN